MQNGGVEDFSRIKRDLCNLLSEEMFLWIKGQTDSEHLFALFLDHLHANEKPTTDQVADAFEAMITDLKKLMRKHAITEPAYLNMVYTDGRIAVGLRYVTDRSEPLTMYYSEGKKYICTDNVCHMVRASDKREHAVMIVSEKLTDVADDFIAVPPHHFVLMDVDLTVKVREVVV